MSQFEDEEIKQALGRIFEACERRLADRMAIDILTHVDPPAMVGPQFIGGYHDGEPVPEVPRNLHTLRMALPVSAQMFGPDEPSVHDFTPPMRAEYVQRRDGDWYLTTSPDHSHGQQP